MSEADATKLEEDIDKAYPIKAEGLYGVFQPSEETGGNPRVIISDGTGAASTMPYEERVATAGHETYGHALLYLQGQRWAHEKGGKPASYFDRIEERSKANYRGPQKLASPGAIKPKK